ncbi:MAG: hypothetical protein NT003_01305 [Candidatus Magasanikbacteria bacterium]|nr:hypothetical protein [Candidatus Magasanikbacteria bacterium]
MADVQTGNQQPTIPSMVIHTIPMDFYGGKNPPSSELPVTASEHVVVSAPRSSASTPSPRPVTIATAQHAPWIGIAAIGGAVFVLVGAIFGGWWFYFRTPPAAQKIIPPPPAITTNPVAATSTPEIPVDLFATSTATSTQITTSTLQSEILIPDHTYADAIDTDKDGLTDTEEELWTTKNDIADTDADGYNDGTELLNLYNPVGTAPQRLAETNLVSTYINPAFQYAAYYPASWIAQSLDQEKTDVLFTSITKEFVEIRVLPFPVVDPFPVWFAKKFPNENLSAYTPFVNKFKVAGVESPDHLVAIFTDGSHVYLMTYNGGVRDTINYRRTFEMMVASFKPANVATPIELLPQMNAVSQQTSAPTVGQSVATTTATSADVQPDQVNFVSSTPSGMASSTINSSTSTP